MAAAGAEFGSYGGWERADWFPKNGADRHPANSYDRQHWFDTVGEECRHVAEHAGIIELTGFSRFHLKGDGAADWLASLITGNLPQVGRFGLVYFASAKGKVLTEMSATRLAEDEFLLITGAGAYWHDRDLLNGCLPKSGGVSLQDTTRDYATLLVTGPKSRRLSLRYLGSAHRKQISLGCHTRLARLPGVGSPQSVCLLRVKPAGKFIATWRMF